MALETVLAPVVAMMKSSIFFFIYNECELEFYLTIDETLTDGKYAI